MSNGPTLINIPPPPSDPVTPSDIPSRSGTPNSTTTSMSELSTVAIKDGHRGHLPHPHGPSGLNSQLDAERADRISRLAGLERVATARQQTPTSSAAPLPPQQQAQPMHSYFDASGNPAIGRERSTVGSASATGSVGAHTTWAGSEAGDGDKMSESAADADRDMEMEMDASSVGGWSDEGGPGSLVGFGEGARTPARQSVISSPGGRSGGSGVGTPTAREAKMIDGMTYDRHVVDTTSGGARSGNAGMTASPTGTEEAERIVRENMNTTSADRMRSGPRAGELGKFGFEK